MNVQNRIALFAGVLALAACQQGQPAKNAGGANDIETGRASVPEASPEGASSPPPPTSPAQPTGANPSKADPYAGTNDGYPDLAPTPTTPDIAKTEKGARGILLPWARGIELREFDQSWAMMGDAAKAQVPRSAFNAMFAPLHDLVVAVPAGTMEGAAGSSYYTVPTSITGLTRDGEKKTLKGEVIMRRVNDVPGATPAQLTWHIEQVNLRPSRS